MCLILLIKYSNIHLFHTDSETLFEATLAAELPCELVNLAIVIKRTFVFLK